MWTHKKDNTGLFIGSYDFNKKSGLRFFELFGIINGKKVRLKFSSPSAAKKAGWSKVN